jgi:hypothetical protein
MTNALCFVAGWLLMDVYRAWRKSRERKAARGGRHDQRYLGALKLHGKCPPGWRDATGLRCPWPQCTPGRTLLHFKADGTSREYRREARVWPKSQLDAAGSYLMEYSWVPR